MQSGGPLPAATATPAERGQIDLLAEKEMTKVLRGVIAIADRLGLVGVCDDPESREMATDTNVEAISKAVERAAETESESARP